MLLKNMTQTQIKERLNALVDTLPEDQATLLLDFAVMLRQRQTQSTLTARLTADTAPTEWEAALAAAEEYWFQLPESTRSQYSGRVVALLYDRVLDTDTELKTLRRRVTAQYPDQPVLYLDADAEQEPPLFVLSPHLK
jgi:hypothetical protein